MAFLILGRPASGPRTFFAWIRPPRTMRGMGRSLAARDEKRDCSKLGLAGPACDHRNGGGGGMRIKRLAILCAALLLAAALPAAAERAPSRADDAAVSRARDLA